MKNLILFLLVLFISCTQKQPKRFLASDSSSLKEMIMEIKEEVSDQNLQCKTLEDNYRMLFEATASTTGLRNISIEDLHFIIDESFVSREKLRNLSANTEFFLSC